MHGRRTNDALDATITLRPGDHFSQPEPEPSGCSLAPDHNPLGVRRGPASLAIAFAEALESDVLADSYLNPSEAICVERGLGFEWRGGRLDVEQIGDSLG